MIISSINHQPNKLIHLMRSKWHLLINEMVGFNLRKRVIVNFDGGHLPWKIKIRDER